MRYVDFGTTGLKVSTFGLGGAQALYNKAADRKKVTKLIRYAYDRGVTLFDTSPWYQSEDLFGEGLKGLDRNSFVLTTKAGRYATNQATGPAMRFDFSAQNTEESVKHSLELLQMSYIDVIQIHDFEYEGDRAVDLIVNETLPAMQRCRDRGLVKFIGLACYDLPKTKQVIERSQVKVDSVLNHSCLTLIDQELADYMPFFKERGIAVMNGSPLAHGLLTQRPLPSWIYADDDLKAASRQAVKMTQEAGMSLEKLAICYGYKCGEDLGVEVFLSGCGSIERLDENLAILDDGLTPAEWDMCYKLRNEVFDKLPQNHRNWVNNDVFTFNKERKQF